MSKTLITSLGSGMYAKGSYRTTTYRFLNGKEHTCALFLDALLTVDPAIKQVEIIGTSTSSWDVLCELCEDTWLRIRGECESPDGMLESSHDSVLRCLGERYPGVAFSLHVHTSVLGVATAEHIFSKYQEVAAKIEEGVPVVLDITHGFRSMPLLVWQALQQISERLCSVQVLYGEYLPDEKISYVRDLSSYWTFAEIAKARQAFISKLDGFALADYLEPYWEKGAKAIRQLSGVVASNFALQIPAVLRQINNAVVEKIEGVPQWVLLVRDFLEEFYKRLSEKQQHHEVVLEYARALRERKLYTQAVIAQQIAVELFIAGDNYGDYEWWKNTGRTILKTSKRRLPRNTQEALSRLEELRNQIAHGGYKSTYGGGGFPQYENIPNTMTRTFGAIEELFERGV